MGRALDTLITLVLEDQAPELAEAHNELYPERVVEHIPLSLTLLYPWMPAPALAEADLDALRRFFTRRQPFDFDLVRVVEFPGLVAYAVPEPDDELRATMRALWASYPAYPPYGRPGYDPPPHATLGRLTGNDAVTLEAVEKRVGPYLPAHFAVDRVTLMEEYEPDRWRVRESFSLGR